MQELKQVIKQLEKIPEPSFKEIKTTQFIINYLNNYNIPIDKILKTGCFGTINTNSKKTIAVRADIDALPSKNKKKFKHLCGHHIHTGSLLCALKEINKKKEKLNVNIRYLFQPAEETGEGAKFLIENGAINNVDEIYAVHVFPDLTLGKIKINETFVMAGAKHFKISLSGKQTHGAFPHKGNDLIIALSDYINITQKIISRLKDPTIPALISFCQIEGGVAPNILPENITAAGTIRFLRKKEMNLLESKMKNFLKEICRIYKIKGEIIFSNSVLPVKNNKKLMNKVKQIFSKNNKFHIIINNNIMMGSEDFSCFLESIPGLYLKFGIKDKNNTYPLHHPNFKVSLKAAEKLKNFWVILLENLY